jgi:Holliday junction resolvase
MVNSIQKGKSFERQVVNILKEFTKDDWKRVPMSGAFSTINKSEDKRFFGDVFSENQKYLDLVVECKKSKAPINLFELINPKGRIVEWITQTRTESKGKYWILIFSWNNSKIFYITEHLISLEKLNIVPQNKFNEFYFGVLK